MRTLTMTATAGTLAVLIGFVSPAGAGQGRQTPEVAGLKEGLSALDEAIKVLSRPDFQRRPQVRVALKKLSLARLRMKEGIRDFKALHRAKSARPDAPPPRGRMLPRGPLPIEYGSFDEMIGSLKKLAFGDDRLKLLNDARKRHYFTTEQVRRVMSVFQFGGEKVKAAASLYPRVVDKQNFFKVYTDLEFEDDRKTLRKQIDRWDNIGLPPKKDAVR